MHYQAVRAPSSFSLLILFPSATTSQSLRTLLPNSLADHLLFTRNVSSQTSHPPFSRTRYAAPALSYTLSHSLYPILSSHSLPFPSFRLSLSSLFLPKERNSLYSSFLTSSHNYYHPISQHFPSATQYSKASLLPTSIPDRISNGIHSNHSVFYQLIVIKTFYFA